METYCLEHTNKQQASPRALTLTPVPGTMSASQDAYACSAENRETLERAACASEALLDINAGLHVVATLGADGVALCYRQGATSLLTHFQAIATEDKDVASVTGCGDCLVAGVVSSPQWWESSAHMKVAIERGIAAATLTLVATTAVPPTLDTLKTIPHTRTAHQTYAVVFK